MIRIKSENDNLFSIEDVNIGKQYYPKLYRPIVDSNRIDIIHTQTGKHIKQNIRYTSLEIESEGVFIQPSDEYEAQRLIALITFKKGGGVGNDGGVTLEQLNQKQDKETGKGLSSNDFTNAEKTKLEDLENYQKPSSEPITYINGLQEELDKIPDLSNLEDVSNDINFNKQLVTNGQTLATKKTSEWEEIDVSDITINSTLISSSQLKMFKEKINDQYSRIHLFFEGTIVRSELQQMSNIIFVKSISNPSWSPLHSRGMICDGYIRNHPNSAHHFAVSVSLYNQGFNSYIFLLNINTYGWESSLMAGGTELVLEINHTYLTIS